jgi:acylphosphatase
MKVAHVFISGFVQGIGFRQFILRQAQDLRLTGWVRNIPDGRVEAIFQGQKEKIEEMIKLCRKGPFLADIKRVDVEWEENQTEFEGFEIVA